MSRQYVEGLSASQLEALSEVNKLEVVASKSEKKASDARWKQAERVYELVESGMSKAEVARQWKKANGESVSRVHVVYTVKAWEAFRNLGYDERPPWNEAYHSDEVRGRKDDNEDSHDEEGDEDWGDDDWGDEDWEDDDEEEDEEEDGGDNSSGSSGDRRRRDSKTFQSEITDRLIRAAVLVSDTKERLFGTHGVGNKPYVMNKTRYEATIQQLEVIRQRIDEIEEGLRKANIKSA